MYKIIEVLKIENQESPYPFVVYFQTGTILKNECSFFYKDKNMLEMYEINEASITKLLKKRFFIVNNSRQYLLSLYPATTIDIFLARKNRWV